jgi:hypothetical protein
MHIALRVVFGAAGVAIVANLAHRQYAWVKANADASAKDGEGRARKDTLYRRFADRMGSETGRRFEEALRRNGAAA